MAIRRRDHEFTRDTLRGEWSEPTHCAQSHDPGARRRCFGRLRLFPGERRPRARRARHSARRAVGICHCRCPTRPGDFRSSRRVARSAAAPNIHCARQLPIGALRRGQYQEGAYTGDVPPGLLMLVTRPLATGSEPIKATMEIDDVAAFASKAGNSPPLATITSTWR